MASSVREVRDTTSITLTNGRKEKKMIIKNDSGSQASEIALKGNFNKLSSRGLLDFALWYKENSTIIAEQYANEPRSEAGIEKLGVPWPREETLNEYALWLFQEYPQRVTFLKRQVRADELYNSIIKCELEDEECDPRAGSAPYLESAMVRENGLERTLDRNELDEVNELCADGVAEMYYERYA